MLTVRLHGHLEEKYGSEFRFEAGSIREVIDALQANFDDFTEEFIKDERAYNILINEEVQEIAGCLVPVGTNSVIDIIPIIGGAGFLKALGLIIVGAFLILATSGAGLAFLGAGGLGTVGTAFAGFIQCNMIGGVIASAISAIGWGLALAGVASLLAGPDGPDGGGPKSSSLSQVDNIVGQGMPIPVGYGRLMVGSIVVSATSSSSYTETSKAWTYLNTQTDTWVDKTMNIGKQSDVAGGTVRDDGYMVPITSYDGGYSNIQMAEINATNEANLGGGTFEVINQTTSSGTVVATTGYKAIRIAGFYTGDIAINHR
jgi:predicted phage tail protein